MTDSMLAGEHLQSDYRAVHTFESLFNVDSLLSAGLEVRDAALGLAEGHRALR
jgi:hypothetical protein